MRKGSWFTLAAVASVVLMVVAVALWPGDTTTGKGAVADQPTGSLSQEAAGPNWNDPAWAVVRGTGDSFVGSPLNIEPTDTLLVIVIDFRIAGCVCHQYDHFDIVWDVEDRHSINLIALTEALREADDAGGLLCDCSKGSGKKYRQIISGFEPINETYAAESDLLGLVGIRVKLKDKVWLDFDDVGPNLTKLFGERRETIFYHRQFDLV